MDAKLQSLIDAIQDDVIRWRRHIHQNPELSFQELGTAKYICEQLSGLPHVELKQMTPNSVQAYVKGAKPGKRIALRADIDALPVPEDSDEPFRSTVPGVSHTCGHDAHVAMLMGAIKVLSQLHDGIKGEVVCIFQHAEELPPGGSQPLIDKGILDGVDMIFSIHVRPEDPVGILRYIPGVFCAAVDNFDVAIKGHSAHGAYPHTSIDPIVTGAQFVTALQTVASRRIEPRKAPVLTVATFTAEGGYNTIPDTARLAGTLRSHDNEVRAKIRELLEETLSGVCAVFGAGYELKWLYGYAAGVNHDAATEVALASLRENMPDMTLQELPRLYSGEDFANYGEKIPALQVFLGTASADDKNPAGLHNSKFRLDERALAKGIGVHVGIVKHMLID